MDDHHRPKGDQPPRPAVPIAESISQDFLICLEDGRPMKMLKRHLRVHYNMTPQQYRERWGSAGQLSHGRAALRGGGGYGSPPDPARA